MGAVTRGEVVDVVTDTVGELPTLTVGVPDIETVGVPDIVTDGRLETVTLGNVATFTVCVGANDTLGSEVTDTAPDTAASIGIGVVPNALTMTTGMVPLGRPAKRPGFCLQ